MSNQVVKDSYGNLKYATELVTGEFKVLRDQNGNVVYAPDGHVVCVAVEDESQYRNKYEEIMKISTLARQRINAVVARNNAQLDRYGANNAVLEPVPEISQVITDIIYECYL